MESDSVIPSLLCVFWLISRVFSHQAGNMFSLDLQNKYVKKSVCQVWAMVPSPNRSSCPWLENGCASWGVLVPDQKDSWSPSNWAFAKCLVVFFGIISIHTCHNPAIILPYLVLVWWSNVIFGDLWRSLELELPEKPPRPLREAAGSSWAKVQFLEDSQETAGAKLCQVVPSDCHCCRKQVRGVLMAPRWHPGSWWTSK